MEHIDIQPAEEKAGGKKRKACAAPGSSIPGRNSKSRIRQEGEHKITAMLRSRNGQDNRISHTGEVYRAGPVFS
jgi:hypothetical protein